VSEAASGAGAVPAPDLEVFDEHRSLLFTVAYELLGSVTDAEDVVQETYLRWAARPDEVEVRNARAYLAKIATRLSLNRLRSLARRREDYVGTWLPEPLLTVPDIADDVVLSESVNLALMVVLESLGPKERAVFLLREVFGYEHAEIAEALGMSSAAVRQTAHRAKQHVEARRPRFSTDDRLVSQVQQRFSDALLTGDVQGLMDLLAPDVVVLSDGGGKVSAARRPVQGADAAARFLVGIMRKGARSQRVEPTMINGVPGWRSWDGDRVTGCLQLVITDDKIAQVLIVVNPDKLGGLEEPHPIAR
jgi:RNA polymerase sigma-70 factor, ECF subfamily